MAETKFGKRIRSIRQNAECSQKEFCAVLDIPQSTLSAYETDRMQPTVATLINIATKYNVSMDWLCGIDKTNGGKYIDSKTKTARSKSISQLQMILPAFWTYLRLIFSVMMI